MTDDNYTPEEFEDDDYEDEKYFDELMQESLSPKVKKFLNEYYGDRFYNLEAETYREIDKTIKADFTFADEIPNILYRYRTITDEDEFDKALDNFVPSGKPVVWKKNKNWFDSDFNEEEDDEDIFLEDSDPVDLTEEQRKAKELIEHVDDMLDFTKGFAHFMRSGQNVIMREAQLFIENRASFDLSILSPEGFEELQSQLDILVETLLEDLHGLIDGDLNGDKNRIT